MEAERFPGSCMEFQYFLLFFSGPVTAATLALFSEAAGRLPLVTLGLIEYIMPTISLALVLLVFFCLKSPLMQSGLWRSSSYGSVWLSFPLENGRR